MNTVTFRNLFGNNHYFAILFVANGGAAVTHFTFMDSYSELVVFMTNIISFLLSQLHISLSLRCHGPLAERLMHTAHLAGNTSGVSKSSSDWLDYTGFPGDVCVAFFNIPPGNKDAVMPNPIIVFTTVTMSAYQDQLNVGFSKVCEKCS